MIKQFDFRILGLIEIMFGLICILLGLHNDSFFIIFIGGFFIGYGINSFIDARFFNIYQKLLNKSFKLCRDCLKSNNEKLAQDYIKESYVEIDKPKEKTQGKQVRFTEEDILYLKNNYKELNNKELAIKLKRSIPSIKAKLSLLKLTR